MTILFDKTRTYSELSRLETHEDRFDYLALKGSVGEATFGFDRWINQNFYRSREWKLVRNHVISRDNGLDLGIDGYEIFDKIIIHHMSPMTQDDIESGNPDILNPEFLITCTLNTHNAIHFGDKERLVKPYVERRPGDTLLWGRNNRR